jgi:hypothetical protein
MPTILASAIISKAKTTLQDTTNVRWTDAELLGYINDGQRAICTRRPDASATIGNVTCVTGTKQSIPDAGTAIIRVIRNMGTSGTTPGRAIRHVPMSLLDANVPDWHTVTSTTSILHAITDPKMPQQFYVYPPATNGTQVEVLYAVPPADVASTSSTISVDDVFATPLVDYVCARAYLKDQDLVGNAERAALHQGLFDKFMDAKTQADASISTPPLQVKG